MSTDMLLEVADLHVEIEGNKILKGLNLSVGRGEVHAIMGLNGSGKSTLASVLAGREEFQVTQGDVTFCGKKLLDMAPEDRAGEGVFLAFQYPVELPGVNGSYFLRTSVTSVRKYRGEPEISVRDFSQLLKAKAEALELPIAMVNRSVNAGFSGGEKKRNEILQLSLLEPKLAILDETDSGLDIDALQIVARGVNALRSPERSFVLITHYQRLLSYIEPDFVHVMLDGVIVKSGGKELALELEERGYSWVKDEGAVA